jgi:hypothetical protein
MKPPYAWSCLACGTRNVALTAQCSECGCEALATLGAARAFRAQHVARGGAVLPGAAIEPSPHDPEMSRWMGSTLASVLGLFIWT